MTTPENEARKEIDRLLDSAGWIVQNRAELNLHASRGVAVREFPVEGGAADYMLFVDQKAVGVIEAKPAGTTLSGVAEQAGKYAASLPASVPNVGIPLPYLYESTGAETYFRDDRDPHPRSRRVFTFQHPETLAEWIDQGSSLRARLRAMPETHPLITDGLWPPQIMAVRNLEQSFAENKPRSLIQINTGSGKTFTAVTFTYRLLRLAKARRILFLVDRNNLGRQAFGEFDQYVTPDDGRKLTELYNVQRLKSNVLDHVSKVHITTIQRLYSILSGEPELFKVLRLRELVEDGQEIVWWCRGHSGLPVEPRAFDLEHGRLLAIGLDDLMMHFPPGCIRGQTGQSYRDGDRVPGCYFSIEAGLLPQDNRSEALL